jgi:hypothetical protein
MLVSGVSQLCEVAEVAPLSRLEHDQGTTAFAALLYQYGAQLDARVLVLMWITGVTVPRIAQAIKQSKEREEANPKNVAQALAKAQAAPTPPQAA